MFVADINVQFTVIDTIEQTIIDINTSFSINKIKEYRLYRHDQSKA